MENGTESEALMQSTSSKKKSKRKSIMKTIKGVFWKKPTDSPISQASSSVGTPVPPSPQQSQESEPEPSSRTEATTDTGTVSEESQPVQPVQPVQPPPEVSPEPPVLIFTPPAASAEQSNPGCSWLPFADFFAILFCMPVQSSLQEDEVVISTAAHPPYAPAGTESAAATDEETDDFVSNASDACELTKDESTFELLRMDIMQRAKVYQGIDESGEYKHIELHWQLQSVKHGVTIHSCTFPGDSAVVVRSKFSIKCPLQDLKDALLGEDALYKLDATLDKFERVPVGDIPFTFARKYMYKAFFPLSPREFIALTTWADREDNTCTLIASSSLPDKFFPPVASYLRAHLLMSSFLLTEVSPTETEVTMINHSHVGVSVPSYIVNKAAVSIPLSYVRSLRKLLEK